MKNKRGLVDQIMIVLIVICVMAMLIAVIWGIGTVAPLLTGEGKVLTSSITTAVHQNVPNSELENATIVATNTTNGMLNTVEYFSYIMIIGLIVGFLVVCFFVRSYPYLSFIWLGIMILMVIFGFILSNAYLEIRNKSPLTNYYTAFPTTDFLLSYLPHLIIGFGIVGGIILFAILYSEPEQEVFGVN